MSGPSSSLYERLGGAPGISDLVVEFYERVLNDPELGPFFQHVSMDHLRHMQQEFFTVAAGGPAGEAPFPVRAAHAGRHIGQHHLDLFVGHLLATLESRDLEPGDVEAIVGRLRDERDAVVDVPDSPA